MPEEEDLRPVDDKPEYNPKEPLPQSWYDLNRKRFGAETIIHEITNLPTCSHDGHLKRVSFSNVECTQCGNGWIDNNQWKIIDGKITS